MATKNYTSLYQIKDYLVSDVAPKYLSTDEMNMASTGLFGYITEALATLGEDAMNMTSIVFKECFANAAENPESLYLMAAIFQLNDLFATPARMPFALLISEDDIISRGKSNNGFSYFTLDANTKFTIDSKTFSLEFDVQFASKQTENGYVHSVSYLEDHKSTLNKTTSQYIKSTVYKYNGINYVAIQVYLRQMTMTEFTQTVLGNDKINVCSYDFDMGTDVQIAGFEAYYTAPNSTVEQQLTKRLQNTSKLTTPFCFYTMPSEGVLRIEFANDDSFFMPEFNSTIRVQVFTTTGASGNFEKYTGTDINVEAVSDRYSNNNGLIMFGQVIDASTGGTDKLTTSQLRDAVIAAQSTMLTYNTANDLALYFKKMANAGNSRIMFMKRRDDALIRLFNAFVLLKDSNGIVLPTNTCDLMIEEGDIDATYADTYRSVIKAGKIFKYSNKFSGSLAIDSTTKITDNLDTLEDQHVYTMPFLTILCSSPVNVGFYLNSVADTLSLETGSVNANSLVQFMVSDLKISRNAVLGEDKYQITMKVLPTTSSIGECITKITPDTKVLPTDKTFHNDYDGYDYIDNQLIKVAMMLEDSGTEICFTEFELYGYEDTTYYLFKATISTDDYISTNSKIKLINSVKDMEKGLVCSEKFVPCSAMKANIYTFYKYTDSTTNVHHTYESAGLAVGYTQTNKYVNSNVNLAVPLNSINGYLAYNQYLDANNVAKYNYKISSVPMVKANYIKDPTRFFNLVSIFTSLYEYLNSEADLLTNNFDIDMKFYNTFGPSKNYVVGDDNIALDKTNIALTFEIKPYYNTDTTTLVKDVTDYILAYINTDFDSNGNNAIYISNLIRKIEVDFASKVEYIIFKGINKYDLSVQRLEPKITDDNISEYYSAMQDYVPEYICPDYKIEGTKYTPQVIITTL